MIASQHRINVNTIINSFWLVNSAISMHINNIIAVIVQPAVVV